MQIVRFVFACLLRLVSPLWKNSVFVRGEKKGASPTYDENTYCVYIVWYECRITNVDMEF